MHVVQIGQKVHEMFEDKKYYKCVIYSKVRKNFEDKRDHDYSFVFVQLSVDDSVVEHMKRWTMRKLKVATFITRTGCVGRLQEHVVCFKSCHVIQNEVHVFSQCFEELMWERNNRNVGISS